MGFNGVFCLPTGCDEGSNNVEVVPCGKTLGFLGVSLIERNKWTH